MGGIRQIEGDVTVTEARIVFKTWKLEATVETKHLHSSWQGCP